MLTVPELTLSLFAGAFLVSFVPAGHEVSVEVGRMVEEAQNLDRRTIPQDEHRFNSPQIETKPQ